MGKKLDALLGRSFKTSKFKAIANLAISRVVVLKNQRQVRGSIARSDVVQLLNLGHHERALLRVEQVIKEQNMLDVFDMVEGYCLLAIERMNLIQQEKICPEELKEAISSLIFAASRCGEFPELQELRAIFTSRFGKEFAARAVELRNNCGVNTKMIQKLSTRMPSLEQRTKVLKEIAAENNIVLKIEELENTKEKKVAVKRNDDQTEGFILDLPQDVEHEAQRKYKDVADAAQAAFKSAAYAAAAARAAVELSRSDSCDPDDPKSTSQKPRNVLESREDLRSEFHAGEEENNEGVNVGDGVEKIQTSQNYVLESREDLRSEFHAGEEENNEGVNVGDGVEKIQTSQNYGFHSEVDQYSDGEEVKKLKQFKRSVSASSSDSADDILVDEVKSPRHGVIFDEIDEEVGEESRIPWLKHPKNEVFGSPVTQAGMEKEIEGFTMKLDINKKPISVRNRKNFHW